MADEIKRIFLWCTGRSVSTALVKCLSCVEGLQVVLEPYGCAFNSGPERKNQNPNSFDPYEKRLHENRFRETSSMTVSKVLRRQSALTALSEMISYQHLMKISRSYSARIWFTISMLSITCFPKDSDTAS